MGFHTPKEWMLKCHFREQGSKKEIQAANKRVQREEVKKHGIEINDLGQSSNLDVMVELQYLIWILMMPIFIGLDKVHCS